MAKIKMVKSHKKTFLLPIIILVVFAMVIGVSFATLTATKNFGNVIGGYFPGNTYDLYYDAEDCSSGTITNGKTYGYNDYLCDPEVPEGYFFEGWYNGNTKVDNDTLVLTNQDVTLTANFISLTHTVSFDADGGGINNTEYFRFDGRTQSVNGTIFNATWGTDYLEFNRANNSVVALGVMNPDTAILTVEFSIPEYASDSTNYYVISNLNGGGYQIMINNPDTSTHQNEILGSVNIEGTNQRVYSTFETELNKKYKVTMSYDGIYLKLFINGKLTHQRRLPGVINPPTNATPMSFGANPNGSTAKTGSNDGGLLTGKIYNATVSSNPRYTKTVDHGGTYGTLPTPTKEFYTFRGWYDGDNEVTSSTTYPYSTDKEIIAKYSYNYVCKYIDNTYSQTPSDHTSIGTKYECDLGDGVARNFYVLAKDNNTGTVRMIMDRNLSDSVGSDVTMTYASAMSFFDENNPGYSTVQSWIHALSVEHPDGQDVANAVGNTSFDITTASSSQNKFYLDPNNGVYGQTQVANANNLSAYRWLFNYLNTCTSYGCDPDTDTASTATRGYWAHNLSASNDSAAWSVVRSGRLLGYEMSDTSNLGVRPVVTLYQTSLYE